MSVISFFGSVFKYMFLIAEESIFFWYFLTAIDVAHSETNVRTVLSYLYVYVHIVLYQFYSFYHDVTYLYMKKYAK